VFDELDEVSSANEQVVLKLQSLEESLAMAKKSRQMSITTIMSDPDATMQ